MDLDPRKIRATVEEGYDRIARPYLDAVAGEGAPAVLREQQERYLDLFQEGLRPGDAVLDLGCGAGRPVAEILARRFAVTGVDISRAQVELARSLVPAAKFVHGDMGRVTFPEESFNAVCAFWSIIHLPRGEHAALLKRIARWLKPGGHFLSSLGIKDEECLEEDWLGAPMAWSHYDAERSRLLVKDAGLVIQKAREERLEEGVDGPESFLWVLACKPV